ncbi:Aldehyde dehydrogenase [Sphaceloma murrayae]|uniref:aldehyde dehydrogenase (NAD(+)) n=1 Tax=Sphaceloma murrayae TaxID=2082308 RepID=A0A2K1QHB5_9PEZI|nr:Aldehyde dehydrogenase [Sphaceloma murrayae]
MATETYEMWVSGKKAPGNGELIPIEDPSTGETFAYAHSASPADVSTIISAAHAHHLSGTWSHLPRHARAAILDRIAVVLTSHLPSLIALEVRQTGRCLRELSAQIPSLLRWFTYYASLLRTEERSVLPTQGKLHNWIDRRPLGVVALITPFNHPLLICVKKLAPALAAGNTVVIKPSELTPLTTLKLAELLVQAGVPDGVVSVLPGYGNVTGRAIVENPLVKKVDVTGSTGAGRAIGTIVGGNLAKFTAELGGKAPVVVFERADVETAVNGVAFASFMASGQTCIAATRVLVQNRVVDQVREGLVGKMEGIRRRMGSPGNKESMMGPIVSKRQLENVERLVESAREEGLKVVVGGERMTGKSELDGTDLSKGYYYPPTLVEAADSSMDVTKSRIWREEVFGPVIVLQPFETEQEAIRLANDSEFGLGAAIWTQDLSQAYRVSEQIDAGLCWVNTHHRNDPSSPWGGVGSSGVGSENGIEAYHAYTTMKSTIINYASVEEAKATEDWFGEASKDVRYG